MPERMNLQDAATAAPPKRLASWYAQGLSDALGDRLLMFDNSDAPSLELLRFRPDLAQVPGFEEALREQVRRLAQFRHPAFSKIRAVQRLEPDDDLALISNCSEGKRLSEVLHRARGPAFASAVIQQLGPALLLFQQHGDGISHGALTADRIVVSPDGQMTIVEHVVGPAIETLGLASAQLKAMGIALPPAADVTAPRLDVSTDWYQLGLIALSALLGRQVTGGDVPQLERLLDGVAHSSGRDGTVLSPWVRQWLDRALQISSTRIESGADARDALDDVIQRRHAGGTRLLEPPAPSIGPPAPAVAAPIEEPPNAAEHIAPSPVAAAPLEKSGFIAARVQQVEEASPPVLSSPAMQAPLPVISPTPSESAGMTDFRSETELASIPEPVTEIVRHGQRMTLPSGVPPVAKRPRSDDAPKPVRVQPPQPATKPAAARPRPSVQPRVQPTAVRIQPTETPARRRFSTTVVAALSVIVVLEAGVIGLMARALWFGTPPAIAVQTAATGEKVLVSSRPSESPPLTLSTAPDLSWVSVTSPSPERLLGGKVPGTGTIRISSPINLKVFENTRQLGSVPGGDLRIAPGKHEIELVNVPFGYRLKQSVQVEAGQTVSIHVAPAPGLITLYAVPTADVSIDGKPVGRTPLGPLPLALGEHTVVFKHPTGATDRQRIVIKSGETLKVIGNLRR